MEGKSEENWMINSEDLISKQKEFTRREEREPEEGGYQTHQKITKTEGPEAPGPASTG